MTGETDAQVCRIASLTIANAMIFHEILSQVEERAKPLRRLLAKEDPVGALADQWKLILDEINYHPIFHVAREILLGLPSSPETVRAIGRLGEAALWVTSRRAALRHDLMGRIYHRLLVQAKPLGAYYTSIPAATLLLKLALDDGGESRDWADSASLDDFRVADLACGTGTLLKSTLQAVEDNVVRSTAEQGMVPDLRGLHARLIEEVLWGFDVLPSAVHLAASALALHEPDVPFRKMRLYSLPLGGPGDKMGSLEFFMDRRLHVQQTLIGAEIGALRVTGTGGSVESLELPQLDLCTMNPPFVRSVGGNLLFGSLPAKDRRRLQARLKEVMRRRRIPANTTAGLGSVFVALGDTVVKPGGQLALVLPWALLSGVAWSRTRKLLASAYDVRYIIVSYEPGASNFSENTDLSETLVIARKRLPSENPGSCIVVNLRKKPRTVVEALALAESIKNAAPPPLVDSAGVCPLRTNGMTLGEAIRASPEMMRNEPWSYFAAFAQTDLVRATYHLIHGRLYIPGERVAGSVPVRRLDAVAELGPDARDIADGFARVDNATAYYALWSHEASEVKRVALEPNAYLSPLAQPKKGRHLRDPTLLWSRAGNMVMAERLRLNTHRIVAARLRRKVLSNTWWPTRLKSTVISDEREKALIVWLNSTFGLLILLATRVATEEAWVKFKKPLLKAMPVLDIENVAADAISRLASAYDAVASRDFQPLPELAIDDARIALDSAIVSALRLPGIDTLREMLAKEPLLTQELD